MYLFEEKDENLVKVLNIIPKNPIARFTDPYSFEIHLDFISVIQKELKWKMVYICSEKKEDDQILNEMQFTPPIQISQIKLEFIGDPPNIEKIPKKDIIGLSAILLCCSYNEEEFFRCGFYINTSFDNDEMNLKIPEIIDVNYLIRNIVNKPRIVIYQIKWDDENDKTDNTNISEKEFQLIKEEWIKKNLNKDNNKKKLNKI